MTNSSKTLDAMFVEFQREAFRLESLDDYSKSGDVGAYHAFLAGEAQPTEFVSAPWMTTVGTATQAGKCMYRVHVLARPLTDYLRFELSWGYRRNMIAGEEFFILDTSNQPNPVQDVPDFWLFDDATVAIMSYDGSGRYTGAEFHDDDRISSFKSYRDTALAHAVPFIDWWAQFGE